MKNEFQNLIKTAMISTVVFISSSEGISQTKVGTEKNLASVLSSKQTFCEDTSSGSIRERVEPLTFFEMGDVSHEEARLEKIRCQLPSLTASALLSFFEKEVKSFSFSEEEKVKLRKAFEAYFVTHPIISCSESKVSLCLDEASLDKFCLHFMPYFVEKLEWYYQAGIWISGGNGKIWGKVKSDLVKKKGEKAKSSFMEDIGGAVKYMNKTLKDQGIQEMTIGEYYATILKILPNQSFSEYVKTLPQEHLNQPISKMKFEKR